MNCYSKAPLTNTPAKGVCMKNDCLNFANKKFPWLNSDGSLKSSNKLRKAAKSWSLSDWEAFLKTQEVSQVEATPISMDTFNRDAENYYVTDPFGEDENDFKIEEDFETIKKIIEKNLKKIPVFERKILREVFWRGKSIRELANKMNCPSTTIWAKKKSALEKFEMLLQNEINNKNKSLKEIHSEKLEQFLEHFTPSRRAKN